MLLWAFDPHEFDKIRLASLNWKKSCATFGQKLRFTVPSSFRALHVNCLIYLVLFGFFVLKLWFLACMLPLKSGRFEILRKRLHWCKNQSFCCFALSAKRSELEYSWSTCCIFSRSSVLLCVVRWCQVISGVVRWCQVWAVARLEREFGSRKPRLFVAFNYF